MKPATTFGKPKPKAEDGNFAFKLPENMGKGRGRITKGKYTGRLTGISSATSKSSGNPMWVWDFVITAGPQAGRDFKLWTVLTDDAAWKIMETVNALGGDLKPGDDVKINKKEIIGVGCTMHIKDDNGQDGDGEFSKLDKISAHPKGAGYRAGGALAAQAAAAEEEGDEESDGPYQCTICGAETDTEEEMEAHLGEEHGEEMDGAPADDEDGEEESPPEEEEEAPPPPRRKPAPPAPVAKKATPAPARGKAPATIGRAAKSTKR